MKKAVVLLLHAGYWIIFLLLLAFIFSLLAPAINNSGHLRWNPTVFRNWMALMTGFALLPGILSFYTFYGVLFNRYFVRRKVMPFLLSGIITVLGTAIIGALYMSLLMNYLGHTFAGTLRAFIEVIIVISFGTFLNGIIGLVMKGFITAYGDIRIKEELNRKNYEVELALVKSQLSPHFLFNTINNIDVLIGIDAGKASEYLNKLSDIMRFMLYDAKTELIPLEKELQYMGKYIELQKIRTANPEYIAYMVTGNAAGITIPPMLFIPFIENAFKHAVPQKSGTGIDIALHIEKDKVIFDCRNGFSMSRQSSESVGGLGNELMRKRLELLYPGKHQLTLTGEQNWYTVKLVLHIDEH